MRCWWPEEKLAASHWETSVEATLKAAWARSGPFDGVIGFSQARRLAVRASWRRRHHAALTPRLTPASGAGLSHAAS